MTGYHYRIYTVAWYKRHLQKLISSIETSLAGVACWCILEQLTLDKHGVKRAEVVCF